MHKIGLDNLDEPSKDTKERIAQELDAALSTMGFVYIKNHGISLNKVTEYILKKYKAA